MNVSSTVKAERTTKRKTSNYSFPKEMKKPFRITFPIPVAWMATVTSVRPNPRG